MMRYFLLWLTAFLALQSQAQISNFKIKSITQLNFKSAEDYKTYGGRFELSGMTDSKNGVLCVSDDLFGVFTLDTATWEISNTNMIKDENQDFDLEAIAVSKKNIFVACEKGFDQVLQIHKNQEFEIVCKLSEQIKDFDTSNTGVEGMDYNKGCFYVSDEGYKDSDRMIKNGSIYKIDRKKHVIKLYQAEGDITELKYVRKGSKAYIYFIERNASRVGRLNIETGETVFKSYAIYEKKDGKQNLFLSGMPYGMGEALFISDTEIWVGLDNGEDEMMPKAKNKVLTEYLRSENEQYPEMPLILIFERGDF